MRSPLYFSRQHSYFYPVCASALLLSLLTPVVAQSQETSPPQVVEKVQENKTQKKTISHHAYANWRSIANTVLSRDGQWVVYALVGQETDGEIVFKNRVQGTEWRFPRGVTPAFSADGRYAAFAIKPTQADLEKARKEKKKGDDLPKSDVGVVDLTTGKVDTVTRVKQFAWPEQGGNFLAIFKEPIPVSKKAGASTESAKADVDVDNIDDDDQESPAAADSKKKNVSAELILMDVEHQQSQHIEHVANFSWDKHGTLLAFSVQQAGSTEAKPDTTSTPDQAKAAIEKLSDGVYVIDPQTREVDSVLSGSGSYKQLRFNEGGDTLAFVTNRDEVAKQKIKTTDASDHANDTKDKEGVVSEKSESKKADKKPEKEALIYQLYVWQKGSNAATRLASAETTGMPQGWGVSEFGELTFSKDGLRLFLSTAPLPVVEHPGDEETVNVDLWHWQDPELQSVQKVNAEKDKHKHYKAMIHLPDHRFIQLATPQIPTVVVNDNPSYALGTSNIPYQMLSSWDGHYEDAYAINLATGKALLLGKKLRFPATLSPAGRFVTAFDAKSSQWMAWRTADGRMINLTGRIQSHFEDHEHDTPEPRSPYGMAGWRADDKAVVMYDQYDLWQVNPDTGAAKNLSNHLGRQRQISLRYLPLETETKPESEDPVPTAEMRPLPDQAWLLTATNQQDRSTGFFRLAPDGGQPEQLMFAPKMLGSVVKAKEADVLVFTQQSFTEFPDVWASNLRFEHPERISFANPQQTKYNWGTQEMIEFTSKDGKKLKALLAKPENFDPSKKYPMMVYLYEKLSDNLHRYIPPAPSQNINVTRYVSNGYIVLRPDIVYQTGHPGQSAMNAVIPAIKKVLASGYVDPKRIGIQGHSWGAYQINYMLTKTDMFRAAEAGAAVGDMVSAYGGIRWGKGVSRAFQYETGQSRMAGTPWNKTAEYIENSAIFHIDKIHTPYLTKHNDGDDAVPWYQAIEFFTAMRRLGKEAYWFNYNGEKHGLKDKENVKHYTVHLDEYFDYFLLGQPKPEWMNNPIPYLQRGRRDVKPLFTPDDLSDVQTKAVELRTKKD